MTTQIDFVQAEIAAATRTATRIGFPAALFLALFSALAFVLGITTPVRSGAFCTGPCMEYPYAEADLFFPRDFLWIGPAILLTPLFTVLVGCIHFCVPPRHKPLTLLALCFSSVSMALLAGDYFVQVLAVQPSLALRELQGVALLTQYNPHGVSIAIESLGYLMLATAFLFTGAAMPRMVRPGAAIRWTLMTAALLAIAAFCGMALRFGVQMALPFELAILMIDWIALVIVGIQLSLFFQRMRQTGYIA